MSRLWYIMAIMPYFSALTSDSVIVISHDSGTIQSVEEASVDENQENILVQGRSSFGSKSVTGRACIVTSRKHLNKVRRGDIVIAPAINSLWYTGLHIAGGIIIEKTDGSGHAVALGKKLDIPVVVGATDAAKQIVDGQTITCDPITRNIYHVAYPAGKDAEFDDLSIQKQEGQRVPILDKLNKPEKTNSRPLQGYLKPTNDTNSSISMDYFMHHSNKESSLPVVHKESKTVTRAKSLYRSHLSDFEDYVLDMQSGLYYASWGPESVFKAIAKKKHKCDDFAIDCIELVKPLFAHDKDYVKKKLRHLDGFMEYIGNVLDEFQAQYPNSPIDFNDVARFCHKVHVESINLPLQVDKKELIDNPIKYKNIESQIKNKNDREIFVEARDMRVVAGLFIRFVLEKKLVPHK